MEEGQSEMNCQIKTKKEKFKKEKNKSSEKTSNS